MMSWLDNALKETTKGAAKAEEANENAGVNFDWQEDNKRPIQITRIDGEKVQEYVEVQGEKTIILTTESTVPAQPDTLINNQMSLFMCSIGSFILGIIVMYLFSKLHIKKIKSKHEDQLKKIKAECDIKVTEARAALDRMLIIASQK